MQDERKCDESKKKKSVTHSLGEGCSLSLVVCVRCGARRLTTARLPVTGGVAVRQGVEAGVQGQKEFVLIISCKGGEKTAC
jgi:hypothetical protein